MEVQTFAIKHTLEHYKIKQITHYSWGRHGPRHVASNILTRQESLTQQYYPGSAL